MKCPKPPRAQHGLAADGASRPRDRSVFEIWNRPDSFPDLERAAAEAQAVGRQPFIHPLLFTAFALSRQNPRFQNARLTAAGV